MKIEIKKSQSASVAHGRGSDSYRTPARYDILLDGKLVGKLGGAKQTYMANPDWSVVLVNQDGSIGREIRSMLRSKKAAVAWIESNVEQFIQPRIIATGGWKSGDPCDSDQSPRGKHCMVDVSARPSGRPGERLVTSRCKYCGGLIVDCPTISA
jgi:hypothetical protein